MNHAEECLKQIDAVLCDGVHKNSEKIEAAKELLRAFRCHIGSSLVGMISEIYKGMDKEDRAVIDREWIRFRGEELPVLVWEKAEATKLDEDEDAKYLVKTNGDEWRGLDLLVLPAVLVKMHLRPNYVRGRPQWIAKIKRPS